MNSSLWRLEEVDGGDEQYPVESRFVVRHTPPDEQDPDQSSRLGLDEQDPVEGWMKRRPRGGLDEQYMMEGWMNSSLWRGG